MACGIGACLSMCLPDQRKWMTIPMYITNVSAKTDRYFDAKGGGTLMNTRVNLAGVELKNPVMDSIRNIWFRYGIQ